MLFRRIGFREYSRIIKITVNTSKHVLYAFSYFIKCKYDNYLSKLQHNIGSNAAKVFCDYLEKDVQLIYHNYLKHVKSMLSLSVEENKILIDLEFVIFVIIINKTDTKEKDLDHFTGA